MSKIYAKQIDPEYQESPIEFTFGFEPYTNMIFLDAPRIKTEGNERYKDILFKFEDLEHTYNNFYGEYNTIKELLEDCNIVRDNGKNWSNIQKNKWKQILEKSDYFNDMLVDILELITDKKWIKRTIRGCCQNDWQEIVYCEEDYSDEAINILEIEFFNLGSEWIVHDEDNSPECAEDVTGFTLYCYSFNDNDIKKEIADSVGGSVEDVVMWKYTGYSKVTNYMIA